MPDGYVTIATYETPIAAELARVRLDGENIPAFVADSNTVGIQPFYGGAIGVRVQVPAEMAEDAVAILRGEQFPIFMDPRHPNPVSENPYDEDDPSMDNESMAEPIDDESTADAADDDGDRAENGSQRTTDAAVTSRSGFQFDKQRFGFQLGAFIVVVYLLFKLLFG